MKKNKIVLGLSALLVGTSLVTTACGKEVDISSKAVVGFENGEIKASDYYKDIKDSSVSALVDMIDTKLFEKKYKTTDEETKDVEKQMKDMKNYYPNDTTYKQALKQYFATEDEKEVEQKLRLEYKRDQAVNDYIEKNLKNSEIKKYYNESIYGDMAAKHILIAVNTSEDSSEDEKEKAEEEALKTAKKVIKELEKGKSFDELAKKYSADEGTALNGGDLGTFKYDEMVEDFSKACVDLKVDEYSKEPVKTEFGYHVILKTRQEEKPTLKKVKSDIKETLRKQKLEDNPEVYYEALKAIREKNGITWNDDVVKKAYNDFMDDLIENAKKDEEE